MPHGITDTDSMFSVDSRRRPPWHGLGAVLEQYPKSIDEALQKAGLGWKVSHGDVLLVKRPEWTDDVGIKHEPELVPANGFKANLREDTGDVLGIVSHEYEVVDNRAAFAFLDALIGSDMHFETAGSLWGGRRVWVLARLPEYIELGGDLSATYVYVANSHDGSMAVTAAATPIRIVCANALGAALRQSEHGVTAQRTFRFRHTGNLKAKFAEARQVLGMTINYQRQFKELADRLARQSISEGALKRDVLRHLWPIDEDIGKVARANRERTIENVLAIFRGRGVAGDTTGNTPRTKWTAFNAVAEHLDFGRRYTPRTNQVQRSFEDTAPQGASAQPRARGLTRPNSQFSLPPRVRDARGEGFLFFLLVDRRMCRECQDWPQDARRRSRPEVIADDDAIRGGLLGLAVGDALGAPLEGSSQERAAAAVTVGLEMKGNRWWAPGEWTDDTAMALALAESIVEQGLIDINDVARRYIEWANHDGKGIGRATARALIGARDAEEARIRARAYYESGGLAAGNGTVMRTTPIGLATTDPIAGRDAARRDAELTHADESAAIASGALCVSLIAVRRGRSLDSASIRAHVLGCPRVAAAWSAVRRRDDGFLAELAGGPEAGACWTTLGAGLFAVENADSYEAAMRWVIGLGGDTDTNAAVAGALIGARDGASAIPDRWLAVLRERDRIEAAAERLAVLP